MRRATPAALAAAGGATLIVATALMRAGVEPFATWYYPFAWYSVLLVTEAAVARRDGRFFFLDRPRLAFSLFGWSIPFWLFFELLNFRLANWYYVFVPDHPLARWTGITISFATVLPAIFLAERALRTFGPWREDFERSPARQQPGRGMAGPEGSDSQGHPGSRLPARALLVLQALGLGCLLLPLIWPRWFFPLVWVGMTLVADPYVYRHDPGRSLLADLERGWTRRIARLLVGGMAIGLLWELFNAGARGKWIYTVPGLEELKLFEMPLLGFFGFPFLALEGWAAYQALVVAGAAVDPGGRVAPLPERSTGRDRPLPGIRRLTLILAALFSALVLRGLEIETISSYSPRLSALTGAPVEDLRRAGYRDVFSLARAEPPAVAAATGTKAAEARGWIELARLAVLRGIGTENAARLRDAGVGTVRELAAADPEALARRLEGRGPPVPPARLRVWIRASRGE